MNEAMQRYKDQLRDNESNIKTLTKNLDQEKEQRIRADEKAKSMEAQIKKESSNKIQNDSFDRINKLQDDKGELMNQIESLKGDKLDQDAFIRTIIDRMSEVRQPSSTAQKNILDTLSMRIDDLIHYHKDLIDTHEKDVAKENHLKQILDQKDAELQIAISDNKKLSLQIHELLSKKSFSRAAQTDIEAEDMEIFDEVKDRCANLEDDQDALVQRLKEKEQQAAQLQHELDNKCQEVFHLMKSIGGAGASTVTQSIMNQPSHHYHHLSSDMQSSQMSSSPDEVISRLNARIQQLKQNEDILLSELSKLRDQQSSRPVNVAHQEKLGEYEAIVFEQREQLIKLEEENSLLRRQVKEIMTQNGHQTEQNQIRLKNLQEINRKHEQLSLTNSSVDNHQMNPVEVERLRQAVQTLELQNLTLKHTIDELRLENEQIASDNRKSQDEIAYTDAQLIKIRNEMKLIRAGFSLNTESDSNMSAKLIEQRKQIKQLQGLLIRAKQDFDQILANGQNSTKNEDLSKSNEKLRREHHQAIMAIVDLKDEYSSKLMAIGEKHEQIRDKLVKENAILIRSLDQSKTQMSYMEKKEARLFGQLEETKDQLVRQTQEHESRTQELEELIFQKEATIAELEREIRIKEKTLMERQEQISVLISTLEGENSRDESRQKILNLSAELCSVKAIESQQVRKLNDMTHHLKKVELQASKHLKIIESNKSQTKILTQNLEKQEKQGQFLENRLQTLSMHLEEKERQNTDLKYQIEKEQFQLNLKDESISQIRDQLKRAELIFKDELERMRKEFLETVNKDFEQYKKLQIDSNSHSSFKQTLQHIHIALCDLITSHQVNNEDKSLLKEFEKALNIASQTIETLQGELDKSHFQTSRYRQDLKSSALCQILISRQETLQNTLQKLQMTFNQREQERAIYFRDQENSYSKVIREQELKINYLEKELSALEEENSNLSEDYRIVKDQKDELEQNLMMFDQEIEAKKLSMEKRAELSVDERFKAKHETIKCYFDSQLTKIMLNQNLSGSEKLLDLGREILSLKLLLQTLESTLLCEQSDSQSSEMSLAHYKQQHSLQEQRIRDLNAKNAQISRKSQQISIQSKIENEKRKQEVVLIEREIIKVREALEGKTRECLRMESLLDDKESRNNATSKIQDLELQIAESALQSNSQKSQIEELQQRLIDLRAQHLQEFNSLRTDYDSQISESNLKLTKERVALEKRFLPGHAPGDIQIENQELVHRIQELKSTLESINQENVLARRRLENERGLQETLRREVESYKQALVELEGVMCEIQPIQDPGMNTAREPRSTSRGRQVTTTEKKQAKKSTLNKNGSKKLVLQRPEQQSMIDDSCSVLATSIMTVAADPGMRQKQQFLLNPPPIVKALVQSKISELSILKKYDDLLKNEVELRHNLKEAKLKEIHQISEKLSQTDENHTLQLQKQIVELEVENEDLKIQQAHEQVDQICQIRNITSHNENYPKQDYSLMIEALISITTQLALVEAGFENTNFSQQSIEEAQRLVIKTLQMKVFNLDNTQDYQPPSDDQDRKLWYLELMEQQVQSSEQVMTNLQSFIKKLQIDIQGNLQSAASIKSASMDLANNLKKTSDEVKSLKHVIGLAKHDLSKMAFSSQPVQTNIKTINPFSQTSGGLQNSSQSVYNQLVSQQDHLQNQLNITEKVKSSLEQELVSIKIAHKQDLTALQTRLTASADQRASLLTSNEELHTQIESLTNELSTLQQDLSLLQSQYTQKDHMILDKERERQVLASNKATTSKHLAKLQQDMQEWRKTNDENMRTKEKQVEQLTAQVDTLLKERDRIKSENGMLRRVEKDRRLSEGNNDEIKKLQDTNQDLIAKLEIQANERKREIEYWVTERSTMRDMIEQLEQQAQTTILPGGEQGDSKLKKYKKKFKIMDLDIKNQVRQIEELRDEVHRGRQLETQLEQKLRESNNLLSESEERIRYMCQRLKEVELERDLVLAEKNNAISANDVSAQQIQLELNSLRECFAKLKVERDNLLFEMETTSTREREWRKTVERLSEDLMKLENQLQTRERDQSQHSRTLESKTHTLVNELQSIKDENNRLKTRIKEQEQMQLTYEQRLHTQDSSVQQAAYELQELRSKYQHGQENLNRSQNQIGALNEQLLIQEASKIKELETLKSKLDEIKQSNVHLSQLYEGQIGELRQKLIVDKRKTENQADQIVYLAQKESVIKSLKKELNITKCSLTKVKAKNHEFKQQLHCEKENSSNFSVASTKQSTSRKFNKQNTSRLEDSSDQSMFSKIAVLFQNDQSTLQSLQNYSKHQARVIELEALNEQSEQISYVQREQVSQLRQSNLELSEQLDELSERLAQLQSTKQQKDTKNHGLGELLEQTKSHLKQAHQELQQLRQEWIPPTEASNLKDKVKELQGNIKQLREEVQRKKDVIQGLKSQKEQTESDVKEAVADLDSLKDDNAKLQRLIKENAKQLGLVKELKLANDQLRATEKRLRDEVVSLSDKLRTTKQDLSRKDQLSRELKDKIEQVQSDSGEVREHINEIERLKDLVRKVKLEVEIKENQVRSLKVKVEHLEGEGLKKSQRAEETGADSMNEVQLRQTKTKLKKSENSLKRALEALRKIGKEIIANHQQNIRKSVTPQPQKQSESQEDTQMKQFYKDSVNILGMSMDELLDDFVAPQNPTNISMQQHSQTKDLMNYLERMDENNASLCEVIEHVCSLCVKLIQEISLKK